MATLPIVPPHCHKKMFLPLEVTSDIAYTVEYNSTSIHFLNPAQGCREPGSYPMVYRLQGGVHPGQGGKRSQGTFTRTLSRSITQTHLCTTDNLQMPVNLQ